MNKLKKLLIGTTVSLTALGGSLIFTYTADGCSVEYKEVRDFNNNLPPLDKNGQSIEEFTK